MNVLLDTHAVLWWHEGDRRLGRTARRAIESAETVWVSAACGWEVAIKMALGKLRVEATVADIVRSNHFTELPVALAHCERFALLELRHRDPFDRMLVAQAMVEGATLVTRDSALGAYGVPVLW
jgi:PIN domain nuclease of toxin-antitoxin system